MRRCALRSAGLLLIHSGLAAAQPVPGPDAVPVAVAPAPPDGDGPSPALAATLALVVPGAGHAYLGDWTQAAGYLAGEGALIGGGLLVDHATDDKALGRHFLVGMGVNLHMYQVFDAYRDARRAIGDRGYRYPVDDASYYDLLLAPVDPDAMLEWRTLTVAGGLAAVGIALRVAYHDINFPDARRLGDAAREDNILGRDADPYVAYFAAMPPNLIKYSHVGLGEETLFRGVVQGGMKEWWGPGWAIAGQSVAFSAFHIVNAAQYGLDPAAYFYAMAAGVAFGWLQESTGDLRHGVGAHAWVDFLYTMTNYFYDPEHNVLGFSVDMPI